MTKKILSIPVLYCIGLFLVSSANAEDFYSLVNQASKGLTGVPDKQLSLTLGTVGCTVIGGGRTTPPTIQQNGQEYSVSDAVSDIVFARCQNGAQISLKSAHSKSVSIKGHQTKFSSEIKSEKEEASPLKFTEDKTLLHGKKVYIYYWRSINGTQYQLRYYNADSEILAKSNMRRTAEQLSSQL